MARGRDPDVLVEVLANRLFAVESRLKELLAVFEPVAIIYDKSEELSMVGSGEKDLLDAPHVKGDVLAKVANDDLELRVPVKDAVGDHAQQMQAHTVRKGQRRANEP